MLVNFVNLMPFSIPMGGKKSLVIFVRDKLYTRLTEMGLLILNRDGSIQGCDPELNKEEAS